MADNIQTCNCIPYDNINCCGSTNGISVMQPKCQTIPDGRVVNNPCFDSVEGKSYWSYKFITDCTQETRGISGIAIPICLSIPVENIVVKEKVDGCGLYVDVDFELIADDPNFGEAPVGFQWVKIETNDRFDKGVCVEYRLELKGNFPVSSQEIDVKAADQVIVFDCDGGFAVPACNPQGTLNISKDCSYVIENNEAILNYKVEVSNIGNASLRGVQFSDVIIVPTSLTLGNISIEPSGLDVNTTIPGEVIISGTLGDIDPSQVRTITYRIPIVAIGLPGSYIISSTANASATGTDATASCITTLAAAQINTTKCCQLTSANTGEFQVTLSTVGQSPDTVVNIVDNIIIPSGVTLQFNSFDGCTATYANSPEIVPTNTNLVGPLRINIVCDNVNIPAGGFVRKRLTFTIVSISVFRQVSIQNTVESVTPAFPERQIFLGAGALPVEADVTVEASIGCTTPCTLEALETVDL